VKLEKRSIQIFLSSTDLLLLPGQVEQDVTTSVPSYIPSVDQPLPTEVKPNPTVKRADKQTEEVLPSKFSLDSS
jgi:hypothetical protein